MDVLSTAFLKKYCSPIQHTFAKHLTINQILTSFFNKFSFKSPILYIMNVCINIDGKSLLTILVAFGLSLSAYSQKRIPLFTASAKPLPESARKDVKRGIRLQISNYNLQQVYQLEPESFSVSFPMPDGGNKDLIFHKKQVVSDDFKVTTSDGKTLKGKEFTGVHYQIDSKLKAEKTGILSFSKTELMGVFSDEYGNWNIGKLPDGEGDYILFCERDLNIQSDFHCETEDREDPRENFQGKVPTDKSVQTSGTCKTVKLYFECDYKMYQDNASSTANVTAKVTGMFNCVKQLYSNEQIDVELAQIYVWTTADPYTTNTTSFGYLSAFANNRLSITQDLGHLLSTRPVSLGGVAFVNTLCSSTSKFGFSNINNTFSALPAYSWSIYCITHELGHNFGSKHTHWCGWQLTSSTIGRIDSCYAGENVTGSVNCGSTTRSNINGTVMSYCHVNGAINFNRGFGLLPGAKIRSGFSGATCITGSPVPAFTVKGSRVICEGENINFNLTTSVTGGTYAWTGPNGFSSTTQNPVITAAGAIATGQYLATVSKSGCTSDAKPVDVVVNGLNALPINETFEGTFLPSGWRISNPNNDRTFEKKTAVGGFGTSSNCLTIDNYNLPTTTNRKDTIYLPSVNLSGLSGTTLKFDVAHAWNSYSFDTLAVVVSTTCGKTFTRVFAKGSTTLTTSPNTFNSFTPTSTQWRKETINLSAYNGQGAVQIAFVNISGNSNFIYLDNINVSTTGGAGAPSIAMTALTQTSYCAGASFNVSFTPTGTFNTGNTYTAQLSNATGSFTSPVTVGSGTGSPLSVTIPTGAITGSGYLIRIVASNPAVTSSTSAQFTITPLVVAAGTDKSVCDGAANLNLTATPTGGTWSGSGVSTAGVFTPTTLLVGNQTITYSVTSSGCSGTDQIVVTVKAKPIANAGPNLATCSGATPFALTGFSPSGGTWSGNGVSTGGTFTPSVGLIGTNTLTYSVTSNGCTGTDTRTMTVSATVTVSAGANQSTCSNGSSINLIGNPSGGTWSGSGVTTGGVFTPSSGLAGSNILVYSVTGTCAGTSQTTVTVTSAPTVNAGIDQSFCLTDSPYSVIQGSPSGGTWSGSGITAGIFSSSVAGVGTHTLTYSVTQSGCTSSSTVDFTVNSNPAPSAGLNQNSCEGGLNVSLTGTPSGGTWSGNNVNAAGIFTPLSANLGPNTLTYSLTQNGCSASSSITMTVNPIPVVNAGPDQSATTSSGSSTLAGTPSGGSWIGTGVTGNDFNPSAAGQGSFTLTYSVSVNGCSSSDEIIFVVLPSATVNAGADLSVCETASAITLNGSPVGGIWSGNGVSPEGIFTPSASLSGPQTLTYTVSGNGTDNVVILVNSTPAVTAGSNQSVCSSASNFTLTGGSPSGGTWTGTGISGGGLVTTSSLLTSGSTFAYSVNQGGCIGSAQVIISVVSPPTVNAGSNQSICKNAAAIQLVAVPAGGTWTGSGVNPTGLFNPASVSNGNKTLTYTVVGSIPGCSGSDQMVMAVFNIPTVSAGIDRATCANSAPFLLTGTPAGGSWSGQGLTSGGLFTPVSGLVGVQTVTYSVTQSGCSNSSTSNITVNSIPGVIAGSNQSICTNSNSFTMVGASPAGGTWTGASFVNNTGICTAPFTVGTYSLTYTASENGCTSSAQTTVSVNSTPVANAGSNRSVCANGNNLTLNGFTPSGGVWSGNGVSPSGVFSPSLALTGNQNLTYSVSQNGCIGSDVMNVTVKTIPNITTGSSETICASGLNFKINGYSPRGGVWSGPGIIQDSLFSPNQSLLGSQTITYSATQNGCTASAQKAINVTPTNVINPGSTPTLLCANSLPVSFSGFTPVGGIWKGQGIAPNGLLTPSTGLVGIQTYTYRLDLNGCRDSILVQTSINALPAVNAGPDLTACATGASVALTNATPSGGLWAGAGVNDTGIFSPSSVTPGTLSLTYSVTQNGCIGSDVININVSAAPSVNGGNDRNICKNSVPVNIQGAPVGGTWSGMGISSTGVFTPTTGMTGNITLTYAINENGCTGSDQVIISMTNAVSVTAGANQTLCDNENPFTMAGFSPAGGSWSGPGILANGTFNPDSTLVGTQTVVYRVTKNNCTVEASKIITVNSAPSVVAGVDQSICSNSVSVQLAGFSPAGGIWSGAGINSTGLVTPAASGISIMIYSFTANGCIGSDSRAITFVPAPSIDAGPNQTVCGLTPDQAMEGYFPSGGSWSGTGITVEGVFSPVSGNLGNTVTVTYSVFQNGCSSSDTKSINVIDIPSGIPVVASITQSCEGTVIPLNLPINNPATFVIQWKKDGNSLPGANEPILPANASGIYQAEIKVSSCTALSEEKNLVFIPIPSSPTISQTGNTLTSNIQTNIQWKRNGQLISGATQVEYTPTQSGIYTVVGLNTICESSPSNAIVVTFTENEEIILSKPEIRVYPNPNPGKFVIELNGFRQPNIPVSMLDALGRVVWQNETVTNLGSESQSEEINLPGVSSGMYWLKVEVNGQPVLKKVIIK